MSKFVAALGGLLLPTLAFAQPEGHTGGGEANLTLPDLSTVNFLGMNGHALLMIGLLFCFGGLLFGLGDLHAAEESAGASVDAGNFRADL